MLSWWEFLSIFYISQQKRGKHMLELKHVEISLKMRVSFFILEMCLKTRNTCLESFSWGYNMEVDSNVKLFCESSAPHLWISLSYPHVESPLLRYAGQQYAMVNTGIWGWCWSNPNSILKTSWRSIWILRRNGRIQSLSMKSYSLNPPMTNPENLTWRFPKITGYPLFHHPFYWDIFPVKQT